MSGMINRSEWIPPKVEDRKWFSNAKAMTEIRAGVGLWEFATFHIGSRVLSHGFAPEWLSGGIKLTIPNNKELRFNGIGLDLRYLQQFRDATPSLGGYRGFLPEGFMAKGGNLETQANL